MTGAALGSALAPRFRIGKLSSVNNIMIIALIIGLSFGIIPMTIKSIMIAVPLLFIINLAYNVFINAFFTNIGSILIYVIPRGEFGIVDSSAWTLFTVSQIVSAIIWTFIGTAIGAPRAMLIAMVMGIITLLILNLNYGKVSFDSEEL
ncbi:hypothetical protein JCM16161A_24490 [Vulcanisaeta sp. JCM 16161]|uniref:hypothetical protein n=1 Tax=Vulcanisaeta sp. JCM 16161 TaxID=1295372 RepID=UPI0006D161FB|nr:hypothetical protein [Vulcanisaeta sp. JCM 16161]